MKHRTFALAGVAAIALLGLGGCDLDEQERLFHLGKARSLVVDDNPLNEGQREELRERVAYQAWPSGEGFGMTPAGIYYAGSNVRPPGVPESDVPPPNGSKP